MGPPQITDLSIPTAFDSGSYQAQLQAKLAELQDFVESQATQAASKQKCTYDQYSTSCSFCAGDPVWLPTAGKLDPGISYSQQLSFSYTFNMTLPKRNAKMSKSQRGSKFKEMHLVWSSFSLRQQLQCIHSQTN